MSQISYRPRALALLVAFAATLLAGCGPKDADPHAKIDDPGYYNGPKTPKGAAPEPSQGEKRLKGGGVE